MIADACELWLNLLRADTLKPHLTTVMKWLKEAVTENHFLANLLHPKYKGKHFIWSWWRSCTTAAPEASSRSFRSYCRSVCIHRKFRPISSFSSIIRMCWLNVTCCVVDICVKLQMQSVTTSDKDCTETTSSAIEFRCNWMSNFQLRSGAKRTTKSAWKRQQNLWHATDSCVEMLNWTGVKTEWNEQWNGPGNI